MDPERLINDFFDVALTPEEEESLSQWIRSHPDHARQFARAAFLHHGLHHRLSAMRRLHEDARLANTDLPGIPAQRVDSAHLPGTEPSHAPIPPASPPQPRFLLPRLPLRWTRLGAIAAGLLLALGVLAFVAWPRTSPARLVAVEHGEWEPGAAPLAKGDRVPRRLLALRSGLIELAFDNGNRVIIEGPARFTVTGAEALALDQGTLTATVTTAGHGFRVSTPTARITDLGTEFGVKASASATRVAVFNGTVRVEGSGGRGIEEVTTGGAVEVSTAGIVPVPFAPSVFTRAMPSGPLVLDLVDLLAGGDGTGSAQGMGVDAATGRPRETRAVASRLGSRRYVRVSGHPVLDGAFIPGGQMPVDSAGHNFTFPTTSLISYGLIWAGPNIPWEGKLPIATTLPNDAVHSNPRVMVMHSNNGITFNLDAIRALHAPSPIASFHARVGNSYRPATPTALPAKSLASIHVIVDGVARFEKHAFANTDAPIEVNCPLESNDRFLTLATTEGGDGSSCDWVLWTSPELIFRPLRPEVR